MESRRFHTDGCKQPKTKVVSFEDYCHQMDGAQNDEAAEAVLGQRIRRQGMRRNLEVLCLLLEAGVCITLMLVLVGAALRFFGR